MADDGAIDSPTVRNRLVLRPVVVWHVLRGVGAIVKPLPFPLHAEVSRPNPHVDAGIRSERHDRIVVMSKLEVWQVSA